MFIFIYILREVIQMDKQFKTIVSGKIHMDMAKNLGITISSVIFHKKYFKHSLLFVSELHKRQPETKQFTKY